jgi:amino-acid N-acetyltransferase
VKLVLVHGSRPQINTALAAAGITSAYHKDLRITDHPSLAITKQVVGQLSIDIEARFSLGLVNSPMHGADIKLCRGNFVTARPYGVHDGVDFCNTGLVRKVQAASIEQQLLNKNIVLLSNLGYSTTGEVFNLSAEEVATEVAIALKADKLILFVPGQGVKDSDGELITTLSPTQARDHLSTDLSQDPADKICINHALKAAIRASENNVHRTHLISYQQNGALLQELFTREGTGSLVSQDNFEELRAATIADVGGIMALIKPLEEAGILVQRSRERLETEIENFRVIVFEGMVIACAALYPMDNESAEIACIATHPAYQKLGRGDRLLNRLEADARKLGLGRVFILTTVATHWFLERGFNEAGVDDLPAKKKQLYNFQRNSKVFIKSL